MMRPLLSHEEEEEEEAPGEEEGGRRRRRSERMEEDEGGGGGRRRCKRRRRRRRRSPASCLTSEQEEIVCASRPRSFCPTRQIPAHHFVKRSGLLLTMRRLGCNRRGAFGGACCRDPQHEAQQQFLKCWAWRLTGRQACQDGVPVS